jgi:hypothetical protein
MDGLETSSATHQRTHLMAVVQQSAQQVRANKSGAAGKKDFHQLALCNLPIRLSESFQRNTVELSAQWELSGESSLLTCS